MTADDLDITSFDVAEYLRTPEEMAAYLTVVREEHPADTGYFLYALANAVRAQKMVGTAAAGIGTGRTPLCTSLSDEDKPAFETIEGVLDTLGLELVVRVKPGSTA